MLRSLHTPGAPLLLPNAWDVATAKAVVEAGFPVVATMEPSELVSALRSAGAAGCNPEDTNHVDGSLRDPDRHAEWLSAVRQAASDDHYPLVINARVDVFIWPYVADPAPGTQDKLVDEAPRRATAYLEAGADCVYPVCLWETDPLRRFMAEFRGPVNISRMPEGPAPAERAALGVARVSWALFLYWDAIARFKEQLASLAG